MLVPLEKVNAPWCKVVYLVSLLKSAVVMACIQAVQSNVQYLDATAKYIK